MSGDRQQLDETESQYDIPRHGDLVWPIDAYYVFFHPLQFFRTEIHGMSFRGAMVSAAMNTVMLSLLVGVLVMVYGSPTETSRIWPIQSETVEPSALGPVQSSLLWVALTWAAVAAWLAILSLTLTAGMSGCRTFREAWPRAFRVAAATTAFVWPMTLVSVFVHLGPVWVFVFLISVYGRSGAWVAVLVFSLWALAMMTLGLLLDESPHRGLDEEWAGPLCPRCGYALVVTTEGRCPECGQKIGSIVETMHRKLSAAETAPSVRTLWNTWTRAALHPREFWSRCAVVADSDCVRNAWLVTVGCAALAGGGLSAAVASPCGPAYAVAMLLSTLPVFAAVLVGNQLALLAGMAVARIAGNRLPFHALARAGYHSLGLPTVLEALVGFALLWGLMRGFDRAFGPVELACTLAAGTVEAALVAWSLWAMIRGMATARGNCTRAAIGP